MAAKKGARMTGYDWAVLTAVRRASKFGRQGATLEEIADEGAGVGYERSNSTWRVRLRRLVTHGFVQTCHEESAAICYLPRWGSEPEAIAEAIVQAGIMFDQVYSGEAFSLGDEMLFDFVVKSLDEHQGRLANGISLRAQVQYDVADALNDGHLKPPKVDGS